MKTPMSRLAKPALFAILTLAGLTAHAQSSQPSIARMLRGAKTPPSHGLLECGQALFKATLTSTGSNYAIATFENAAANAVCGNSLYDTDLLHRGAAMFETPPPTFENLQPVESYNNGSVLNVSAYFNPGLRRVLRKGRTELFACSNEVAQAEIVDLQNTGYISLKFRDARLESKCGEGRYFAIMKLLTDTIHIQKNGPDKTPVAYSETGYMECGPNYYAVKVDYKSTLNDTIVHFINPNAHSVCGHAVYDHQEIRQGRGFMAMKSAKFLPQPKKTSAITFLDETRFERGQLLNFVACKNNLGKAQVMNVNKTYGLVTFHFANQQLDALCGQGRYYFTSKVINAGEDLMERMPSGKVRYFAK